MANLRKKFSRIYDLYLEKIYRFIFLKVDSREKAEDLTAETFLRAWQVFQNSHRQREIENFPAFLYKIAKNLIIDYYRQKDKIQFISTELNELNPIIDPKEDLVKEAIFNSDFNEIKTALSQLKEEYQNVLIWYYLDDLSIAEIAKLLARTEGATRVLIHRALNALRSIINKDNT